MSKEIIEGFRLAPQQERVWLLHQKDQSPAYRAQSAILIEGPLSPPLLRAAIENVVKRHEILRTVFYCPPGMTIPLQVIDEGHVVWNERKSLWADETQAQALEIEQLINESLYRPLDFEREEFLQATLLRLSEARHLLLVSLPSLCLDVAGLQNTVRDIVDCYAANFDGAPTSHEPIQYADLSEWQNELLESPETESGRSYWRRQDLSSLLALKLRYQHRPSAKTKFAPAALALTIDGGLLQEVETLAAKFAMTTEGCLRACWQALLWRLTGQPKITVGNAFDGRVYPELKDSPGLFAKYLPVQADFADDSKFAEVAEQIRTAMDEAAKWQESFSWDLIGTAGFTGATAEYFPFAFEYQDLPAPRSVAGLKFSIYKQYACTDRFAVKLSCLGSNQSLSTEFHYDATLFNAEDIERLAGQFHKLLQSICRQPEVSLSEFEILSDAERRQVLVEFNQTPAHELDGHLIHRLVERQAERTPGNIAVVFEDEQVTYLELNHRSNQLAHQLQELGVRPDMLVGVMMDRSVEMVVALLGILKAGAAYLPLDPGYPQERLAFMLADARSPVLLSQEKFAGALPQDAAREIIFLGKNCDALAGQAKDNPACEMSVDNLAYVIYTSGSTGMPKGVMISHRAICNRLLWMLPAFGFTEQDRFLQKTPISFDASVWELFVPLFVGATQIMARPEGHQDSAYLARVIAEQGVTTLQLVPSMLRIFLEEKELDACRSLKRVFCGGEELPLELQQRFHARRSAELHNLYGPTETSIDASHWACRKDAIEPIVTIGRPLPNIQIYLLDIHLQPVPIGVAGELHIGGVGLARGYQNRADLTAESFIPNPFSSEPGARLYQTGDRACFWPDGRIEFLGRIDHQVKIRGFRIELGEIEAALATHRTVREAVVIARQGSGGESRLIAYLVPQESVVQEERNALHAEKESAAPLASGPVHAAPLTAGELRGYLKEKLPEYMIPSAFVVLAELPLMPNGKLDRRALPEPDSQRPELESAFNAPRTPVEEVLAGIWAEVLGLERIGVDDNFFELGGHSLLVTQVITRIRETFHVDLSLRTLFEFPTIAGLAGRTEAAIKTGLELPELTIERVARQGGLQLSFAQQRMWFLQQLEPESHAYNLASAVRLRGELNIPALEQTLNEVVRRHEALRATFMVSEGQPIQLFAPVLKLDLPMLDLSELPVAEREKQAIALATEEARLPFDLTRGPLLRASLLRLGPEDHVALFTQHHIVSDAWSMDVFIREVGALYQSFAAARGAQLPDLEIQYADFAAWQRKWLQGDTLDKLVTYWKGQLGSAPSTLDLPTDRPRPQVQSFRGTSHTFELSSSLKQELEALNRREGVTMFMTLLAVFNTLLSRYAGQDDIVVGTPIANRGRREVEGLIGFFVNTLALRTDLAGNPSFKELLRRVREAAIGAYIHQDMPFDKLVDELQPTRNLNRQPLFQVMIVHQNAQAGVLEMPGLTITSLETETETSQFDLILIIAEWPGGFGASFKYNTDIFDAATIERMARHFRTLLEGVAADPERRLSELPLLTDDERHQLLFEVNDTRADFDENKLLHHLFEAQVESTPDAVALIFKHQQMTYGELNSRANQLARHLRGQGIGPDSLVGIYMERSIEMVVGLLGILKAGGAYVPLDMQYPAERLAFMLEDTGASVLVTQQGYSERLLEHGARVVCLDEDWEKIAQESAANLQNAATGDNLVYVLYTSGSTGRPKGVMISHRGLINYLNWSAKEYRAREGRGAPVHSPIGFDLTVTSLYPSLLTGRSVVLLAEEQGINGLIEALRDGGDYSLVKITPSHLELLSHAAAAGEIKDWTHALIIGGDALFGENLSFWRRHAPHTRLINEYGPTETVVGCCVYEVPPESLFPGAVPIGRPIANTQLYVLDQQCQPVPAGVRGELYIGGAGVARGYIHCPELTAEKFIPHPFSEQPGARLYRTGDLARYLPDGNMEYLGRIDSQVKVRGFRIEPGEIEAVLSQHESVREAVVIAKEDELTRDKQLIAYLSSVPGQIPTVGELRTFLKMKLPEYMIPASFTFLETMPLTTSGKVDRRVLPQASGERPEVGQDYVAPRTEVQKRIAAIWREVLGMEKVGVHDNFFDLGGNSLLMVRVLSKLLGDFSGKISMLDLFKHTTVDGLAKFLSGEQEEEHSLQPSQDRGLARKESVNRLRQLRQKRRSAQKQQEARNE
jgi:amino acid adenylation domain-containing protein